MRLFRNLLLGCLLLAMAAAGAAVIWRLPLLEAAGGVALDRWGFEQADFIVTGVGWRQITVEDASLGPGLPSVRRAEIAFSPHRLLRGEVDRVAIEGFHVLVEGTGQNLKILLDNFATQSRSQQESVARGGTERQSSLPGIMLTDAKVTLKRTPLGDGALRLNGEMQFPGGMPEVSLQASLQTGSAEASLDVRTERASDGARVVWTGGGTMLAGPPDEKDALAWLTAGKAVLSGEGEFMLPGNDPEAWTARLPDTLSASGSISLENAQTAFGPEALTGRMNWQAQGGDGTVRLAITNEAPLTVTGIPEAHRQIGNIEILKGENTKILMLRGDLAGDLNNHFNFSSWNASLTLQTEAGAGPATLAAHVKGDGAAGTVQVEELTLKAQSVSLRNGGNDLKIADFFSKAKGELSYNKVMKFNGKVEGHGKGIETNAGSLKRLAAEGPIVASHSPSGLTVDADGLTAELADLSMRSGAGEQSIFIGGTVQTDAPLLRLADDVLTANVSVRQGGLTVETGERPIPLTWQSAKLDLRAGLMADAASELTGVAAISGAEVAIAGSNIHLTGINATAPLTAGPVSLDLTVSDEASPARFTPAAIRLSGEREGATLTANGQASLADGKALIPLTIEASAADGSGLVRFGPAAISFDPVTLQPADLSPLLHQFTQVSGTATASGEATLQPDGAPKVSMTLELEEISATMDESIQAEGLSGTLTFPSLVPLSTAGEQRLTLRRLVAGVPLDDVDAVFAIPSSARGLTVELSEAGASLAGGRLRAGRAVYRNGAADLRVGVSNLPLERLLAEWKVQGVEATGLISGSLPVAIRPDGVAIQDGKLSGMQSGTIRVDFGSARQTLSSAGEQVDLAVRTLENFHYTSLDLDVSKPLGGELRIGVGLDGNNPDVLDGYPFRFNITLSGRLEPILEAIREGERISTDLLRGSLGQ